TRPRRPRSLANASEIAVLATATSMPSAPEASPPSRPTTVTVWPAISHRRANPLPTLPFPITVIRITHLHPWKATLRAHPCHDQLPSPLPCIEHHQSGRYAGTQETRDGQMRMGTSLGGSHRRRPQP